ncbi:hypothetical protein pb186bvf_020992 [Paramecium bursaria]
MQKIQVKGKYSQAYRFNDDCPMKLIQSGEDKICVINAHSILRIFSLESFQIEKEIKQSDIFSLEYYTPIYQSKQYLCFSRSIENIETRERYYLRDYYIDYVDEYNIYAYKIIEIGSDCILSVVQFFIFGQKLQSIYEQKIKNEQFIIDKYFIVVQFPPWLVFNFIKKQRKIKCLICRDAQKIVSLKNNQFILYNYSLFHIIKMPSQVKLIRYRDSIRKFDIICASLCLTLRNTNNKYQKFLYYDFISQKKGVLFNDLPKELNISFVRNAKNLIFTAGNQLTVLKLTK